ncbi:MAG TPA: YggS family pyridoxal phosphate-dependent enzyme [Polyangiaceae bacterium]|nr:YggS family pyridoxal phosphate-dependent enzyme [Polyangiaceae bacterium]
MRERLERVRQRIAEAAAASGRHASEVRLLAVSKTKPGAVIREAYAAGQRDFGENYLQELVRKAEELSELGDIRWHMIGHLQTNKTKLAAHYASMVHTVASPRVVDALARRRREWAEEGAGRPAHLATPLPVLVEVNIAGEAQKSGCAPGELGEILAAIQREPWLALRGLMTVPPFTDEVGVARRCFESLRALRDAHGGPERLPELSMGMSDDLEAAIAAGATIVRVGTAIFGARAARATEPS